MHTIDWVMRYAAERFADREAIVDGDIRYTFTELADRVNRLAAGLAGLGVKRGDRVAVLMNNSHRFFELHYAIPGMGALIVPINSRLAPLEMKYILENSGSTVLFVDEYNEHQIAELSGLVKRVVVAPAEYEQLISHSKPVSMPGPDSEDDLAGLYYTSGTTGPGKGVMLSHRNHMANSFHLVHVFPMVEGDEAMLIVFPLFHVGAIAGIYGSLWHGGKTVFVPVMDPELILATIEKEAITFTSIVPTLINFLVSHPKAATTDFTTLRNVAHGGSPISPDLCRQAVETFDCRLMQAYGMTECCGLGTVFYDEQDHLDSDRIKGAGRAVAGVEVAVRGASGDRCRPGEVGEITLRGPNIMQGYWRKEEATKEVLRDGWYWSGDLGYQEEDGFLFLVDRSKDMIVTGGENVYSVEVEGILAEHPAVFEVAVIGIPCLQWGEQVHAVVALHTDQAAEEQDLIDFCREYIAGYKCPKSISFVTGELPKSGTGKILKRDLRAPFWQAAGRGIG